MDYRMHYILSFFSTERTTTSSQILHVFQGKRTPSMFYLAEKNAWHHAFAQFKKVSEQSIDKVLQVLLQKGLIKLKDKGYILTEKGELVCHAFYEKRYYPQISSFTNLTIRKTFWDRYQLFVQTFSEISYENTHYTPIIKHPHHQENVRLLFKQFHKDKDSLKEKWIKEQAFLFNLLDDSRANRLTAHLTGHDKVGETKGQVQEQLGMDDLEYTFYHQDTIEAFLKNIREYPKEAAISHAIMNQLQIETNHGLSMSTNATFQLLEQGHSIPDIANIRHLKENTIREHILELAFVFYDFPFKAFVPKELYQSLHKAFEKKEEYTYQDAKKDFEELAFIHYRLVELERMRKNG